MQLQMAVSAVAVVLAAAACTEASEPLAPADAPSYSYSSSGAERLTVCHPKPDGSILVLHLVAKAVAPHRAHGDGVPGDPYPGLPAFTYGGNCQPTLGGVVIF